MNEPKHDLETDLEVEYAKEELVMDQGYAWVMVLAAFLSTFSTWGVNSGYSVYLAYYLNDDHFKGARSLDFAVIGGLSFGVGIVFAPIINWIQGIIGIRYTMLLGATLQFAAALLASFAVNLWQLYLTQGLLLGVGLAFMSLPAMTFVSGWFVKKRVLANLLAVAGSGMGGLTFTLALLKLIEVKGVHWALRAQAIIAFGLSLIAIALVRDRSSHHKVEFTIVDKAVMTNAGFGIFIFYLVTCVLAYVIVNYSLPDYTISLGYSQYQGSIVGAMVQLGFCFGRPLAGFLSDYYGPVTITAIFYYISSIFTLALWIPAHNYASCIALGLCEGIFIGCVFSTCAASLAILVGLPKLNVTFCILWLFFGATAIFSELIGTAMVLGKHSSSAYRNTSIYAGVCFFACATANVVLRGYLVAREKIYDSEGEEHPNKLHITVPFFEPFRQCFSKTKQRF